MDPEEDKSDPPEPTRRLSNRTSSPSYNTNSNAADPPTHHHSPPPHQYQNDMSLLLPPPPNMQYSYEYDQPPHSANSWQGNDRHYDQSQSYNNRGNALPPPPNMMQQQPYNNNNQPPLDHNEHNNNYVAVQSVPLHGGYGEVHHSHITRGEFQRGGIPHDGSNNCSGSGGRRRRSTYGSDEQPPDVHELQRPDAPSNRRRSMSFDDLDAFDVQAESLHRNESLQMSSLHMNDESIHSGINRQRLGSRNENYEEQSMHSVHSNTSHSYRKQQRDQQRHYEDSRRPTLHSSNESVPSRHSASRHHRQGSNFSRGRVGDESSVSLHSVHSSHSLQNRSRGRRDTGDESIHSVHSHHSRRRYDQPPHPPHDNEELGASMHSIHSNSNLQTPQRGSRRKGRRSEYDDNNIDTPPAIQSSLHSNNSLLHNKIQGDRNRRSPTNNYMDDGNGSRHRRGRSDYSLQSAHSNHQYDDNRSIQSNTSSLQRSSRRSSNRPRKSDFSALSDDEDDDDDDYMVGRGQSISSRSRTRPLRRRPSDASASTYGDDISRSGRGGGSAGGERDTWSISKSVFDTFTTDRPGRRNDRRGYDDDDASLFSASSSYSYRRTPSRSSSVGSRVSQLSEESPISQPSQYSGSTSHRSFRLPHKRVNRESTYEYDSDDSLGSLLGDLRSVEDDVPSSIGSAGDEDASASSGSFLFADKRNDKKEDEESSLLKKDAIEDNFVGTLSHLQSLGLGIDGDEDIHRDDDEAFNTTKKKEKHTSIDGDDSAWWITDLEGEGWFQHDTTTVYSSKIIPKRKAATDDDVDAHLDEELGDNKDDSGGVSSDGVPKAQEYDDDDASDTSTVGMEDKDVEDWEERLWTLARSHYLEYSGGDKKATTEGESVRSMLEQASVDGSIDEQSIKDQEELYHFDFEIEQKSVLVFRSLLLKCIETFVNAFHQKVEQSNQLASLKVYRYIPMATARDLFLEVIKMADASLFPEVDKIEATTSIEKRADIITSILVDDGLNIFRRYQVITMKESTKIGSGTKKSRKRLNKGATKSHNDAQAELEEYLYGEMYEEDQKNAQMTAQPDILETKEHEIRIRKNVIKGILTKAKSAEDGQVASYWESSIICKVLLSNIKSITNPSDTKNEGQDQEDNKEPQDQMKIITSEPSTLVQFKDEPAEQTDQPMAQLYSLRYSPIFLLRAFASQRAKGVASSSDISSSKTTIIDSPSITRLQVNYKDLTDLLFDKLYLTKRFELQGPYDATITHLSNWQSTFDFHSNLIKYKSADEHEDSTALDAMLGDESSYETFVALIVSSLHSHLQTILIGTGYEESKTKNVEGPTSKNDGKKSNVSIHNYANIVANCLEIGRALHHLGVCLGRRQRDSGKDQNDKVSNNEVLVQNGEIKDENGSINAVALEVKAYKDALDAYKAAIYVLSKAEKSAMSNAMKDTEHDRRRRGTNGAVQQQEREASNTFRDMSEARDMPSDELQEIREAKISAELHLADTLNCLGYCHDSKLSEYDKSLMAYRESLSLYIRHVGRFHTMVSNALHNMGAIHVELGQWRESASCFRQCLAILKKRDDKEQAENSNLSIEHQQKFITLQCLGNSLSELGEYDSSVACFQEILNASSQTSQESSSAELNSFTMEVQSQMGQVYLKQASKLCRSYNWQCHLTLFSETENKKEEDPALILARVPPLERKGKECILKAIHSRRKLCYAANTTTSDTTPSDVDIFSSVDKKGEDSQQLMDKDKDDTLRVSTDVPSDQLAALAKDLLAVGRVEFRSRSYKAALSYCWESLLINGLLISQSVGNTESANEIRDMLVFNKDILKSESMMFQVPDNIFSILDLVSGIPSTTDSLGKDYVQLLFLIGVLCTRTNGVDYAKTLFLKAQALLNPRFSEPDQKSKGNLEEAVLQLDIAFLNLRIGYVERELGNFETAASKFKEGIKLFNSIYTHPILSSESNVNMEGKSDKRKTSLHELQRKELDMIRKSGFACALHRLGQTRIQQGKSDKAMKCFEDTARMLKEIHDARSEFSKGKAPSVPSFNSRCCWEEVSAISTSMILSDANERSGRLNMKGGSDSFSLQCFERAIGMRESVTSTFGSISIVDTESSLEAFETKLCDKSNMDCYLAMLQLIENKGLQKKKKKKSSDGWDEEEFDFMEDEESEVDDDMLTKEDVLFRMGNLQMKMERYRDAIKSYKEAEALTVAQLGSKDHAIVMNILHNLGNAHRAVYLSSSSKEGLSSKDDAIACYSESIRISQVFFGKQHVTSSESIQDLAILYMKARNICMAISTEEKNNDNDDEFAYKSFKESLSIRKNDETPNELEIAVTLQHLGDMCLKKISLYYQSDDSDTLKFVDEAIGFLAESLKIRKLLLGHDSLFIADTYQSMGVAHLNRALALKNDATKMESEIGKASKAFNSALEVRKAVSNTYTKPIDDSKLSNEQKDSILMEAHCLFYLGRVEETRSKYDEAKAHYDNALNLFQTEGKRRLMRINDLKTKQDVDLEGKLSMELEAINLWAARVLYHMASIHMATNNSEDSIKCNEEALRIRSQCKSTKQKGLNNALIHLVLAKTFYGIGNYDRAIEYYSQSLRTYLAFFGKDSIDVADTLVGMGKAFAKNSVYEKSMQCYDKAMRVLEYREGSAMKEKKGLLHREIAHTIQRLDGDIFEVLEHYRSSVSFLEEYNERHRDAATFTDKIDPNKRLLLYYSEMLAILRQVLSIERDKNIRAELRDEIGDVLHRMGNLHATFSNYDDAMSCFTEVLQTQRETNNDELRIADLLFNMGNIYLEQDIPDESLECLRESYDITKEALGEASPELHSTMYLMGVAMTKIGEYDSASKWLKKALSVLRTENDMDHVVDESARGKTLHQMGTVYEKLGDQDKGLSCLRQSIQILKAFQGDDRELSNALNTMGNLLRNVSDFDQALDCYNQSLVIRTELGDELMIANTKNNIGAGLSAMSNLDRAMAFSAEALRLKTERLGSNSVETGRALINMGQLYLDQKQYMTAERYFQRGRRNFNDILGSDHPDIAMCVHKLGVIKEALSDDDGALEYYLQSINIFKSNIDYEKNVNLAFSLHSAALIYMKQREFMTALDHMIEAVDIKVATLGTSHSETAASQHFLGTIYIELEDLESALNHFKDALQARVQCFGTENIEVAGTLYCLGQVHFKRDEFEEAIDCLAENLRVFRKFRSTDNEEVSKAELLLGSSYQEQGEFDLAKEHLLQALDIMISTHGSNNLDVAQALFRLGICFCEMNDYTSSLDKFKECLEIRTNLLGNLHIECANTYESIGIVQQKIDAHEDAIHSFERALAIKKTALEDDDEDICILMAFIGSSLFELKRYDEAVNYFSDAMERKKKHCGRADEEYAMSVIDLASAYAKVKDKHQAMEYYREAIQSGGLSSDSWELGVAHKYLAGYFFDQNMIPPSIESYNEAVSIFEWNISNAHDSEDLKIDDIIECYANLLDLEDNETGPISEIRADLCYKIANSYVQVNKHEDAVSMYREAIMIQSQLHGNDHLSVANSLHNLGNCYRDLNDFQKSAECLNRSLSLSTVNFQEENEEVADTCHCLALTLMSTCELDEAISLFERALAIRKTKLGALDLNTASTLYSLAAINQMRGTWNNATKYCKEALKIQRMTVGDDNAITARTLECIGRIHMDKREFENAIQCFNKCISQGKLKLQLECGIIHQFRGETLKARSMLIKAGQHAAEQLGLSVLETKELDVVNLTSRFEEKKHQTKDRDQLSFAENVMFYGQVLLYMEKFNEALECYRFSNFIFQTKYGSDHLVIAENLHQTGYLLEKIAPADQLDETLEQLTEALRVRKLHLADGHPDLEETLLCLGRVHHKRGNIKNALNFLIDAIKARDKRLGRKHARINDADALLQVGQLQQQSGQYRQALESFEECLGIRRQILGNDHPQIGELLFYIGNLLREVGDLDLAQERFEESLSIVQKLDPNSSETADTLFSLGVLHTEQKHYSSALDSYIGSLQIHKARGASMVAIAEILNNIGITYYEMKEYENAQVYHGEALESLIQELGEDHTDVAFCWHSLGAVAQELGAQMEALNCFQNAVRIERSEMYLQSLGICLVKLNDNENAFVCLDEAYRAKSLTDDIDDDLAEIQRNLGIIWMRRQKYEDALKCFESALKIKIPNVGDTDKDYANLMACLDGASNAVAELYGTNHMKYARLLHQKGNFHGAHKEHSQAIDAYVEALRIYKGEHGDSHLSVANTLFNLGVSLNAKGTPDKAIRCFTKALRITSARLGEDHLDVADTFEQVAESNKLLHRYNDTVNFYEKALAVRKEATGGGDVKSAAIMYEIGKIQYQQELWDEAEKAFKESIRIRTVQIGQDDPLVAESMYSLGLVFKSRSDNSKALKYMEGSLRIRKSKLTDTDTQLADNFHSLGELHSVIGNADKSVFCFDKAMKIYTEVIGKNSNEVALSLRGKGESLRLNEQLTEALACFSEWLDIRKEIDGPAPGKESGDVLTLMGDIYSQLGDSTSASSSFASALTTYRQIFGTKHPTVADVLQRMSIHFVKVKEYERGYSCVKEALALRQTLLGEDDVKTGDSHYCMGTILYEWKNYSEASIEFERARDVHKDKLGDAHLSVANSNYYLGCIHERNGDYEMAVQCLQEALAGRQEHLDAMDPKIADNLARLGHVYKRQSEYDQAVTVFSDCLKIREATRGTDTASLLKVADALFDLGTALQMALDTQRSMQLFTDALKEYQRHLTDPNDVKIAQCHSCIGEIHEKTNDLTKAVISLELASNIFESHIGPDPTDKDVKSSKKGTDIYSGQAETLFRLATAKDRLGEEATALKQYRKAMRLYKSLFGRDSLFVAKILNRLANMKGRDGSVDKAMVLFDESLRIRMLHLGNNHEDVAETLFGMGIVFEKRRDYGAAMKAYSDCLRIRSSKFGSDSMEVAQVVVNIGVVRGNKGDFSGALKSWNKALSIYRKHGLGDSDALVATVLNHQRLANQLKRRGRHNK